MIFCMHYIITSIVIKLEECKILKFLYVFMRLISFYSFLKIRVINLLEKKHTVVIYAEDSFYFL